MILCLLSCVYQTYDMIDVYPVYIISYHYPFSYHIISLSYHMHQTDSKSLPYKLNKWSNWGWYIKCDVLINWA